MEGCFYITPRSHPPASRTENNATTYFAYTDRGELARTWGATAPVRYEYDDAGRLQELQTYREEPGANPLAWPEGDRTISAYHPGTTALASSGSHRSRS